MAVFIVNDLIKFSFSCESLDYPYLLYFTNIASVDVTACYRKSEDPLLCYYCLI